MYIHYNKKHVYLIIELFCCCYFWLPPFLSSSWDSTSNCDFELKKLIGKKLILFSLFQQLKINLNWIERSLETEKLVTGFTEQVTI